MGVSLANGAVIGAAAGAGIGVAFTQAVRDSDLVFSQYARGAFLLGAIGAGVASALTRCSIVRHPVQE